MKRRISSVLLLALAAPALAGVELVLRDGQTVTGTAMRRDGGTFVIEQDGGLVNIDAGNVAEVRLLADEAPAVPEPVPSPEDEKHKPQQLSGTPAKPMTPGEQTRAIGQPATFAKPTFDPYWHPEDALAKNRWEPEPTEWAKPIVDPNWAPTDAYAGREDPMKKNETQWAKPSIDPSWQPTSGFNRWGTSNKTVVALSAAANFTKSGSAAAGGTGATAPRSDASRAWGCGERLFAGPSTAAKPALARSLQVMALKDTRFETLPFPMFAAEAEVGGAKRRAVFTTAGGECRLLGGDLDAFLPAGPGPKGATGYAAASMKSALGASGVAWPGVRRYELELAIALVGLADPDVSGANAKGTTMLDDAAALATIAAKKPATCKADASVRERQLSRAVTGVSVPRIATSSGTRTVTFYSWSRSGGRVYKNAVTATRDGGIKLAREVVAEHVGDHVD